MTLNQSKSILKICGILLAIGSIITIIFGAIFAFGGSYVSGNMPEAQTNPDYQTAIKIIATGGILMIISGIIHLIQAIFSYKASNNSKYGKNAYIFAILGLIATIVSTIPQFTNANQIQISTIIGLIAGVGVSAVMLYAAKIVKDDNNTL